MSISCDLKILFPKYNSDFHTGSITITEADPGAKVKSLTFTASDFHSIDTAFVKDLTLFFQKAQAGDIFNRDCDGIVLFEEQGKKYSFLTELKSSFDSRDIYHAMHQIVSSYLKANMIMHLLATYEKDDYQFEAFIACYPPKENYKRELHKQLQLPPKSKYKAEAEFTSELYIGKKIEIKATDCEKLKLYNLGSKCLFHKLRYHYIEVPFGHDSRTIDINTYI